MKNAIDYQIEILEKQELNCEDVDQALCDYADDELIPSLKLRIDDHITECEFCKDEVSDYMRVVELARQITEAPMPEGVSARLRDSLNEKLGLNLTVH
ncbi:MAG: hypothetical protein H6619_04595 [Deltaproteobacteria bacterium]|nr:hypothetical protein [Deltaproteobacteria bacterium]